jgi:hypothetical protein
MDFERLIVVCITTLAISGVGSGTFYKYQQDVMMSRNIENGIVKGIDPLAVRCAYANTSDTLCIAYASSKK